MYKDYWTEIEAENDIETSISGLYPEFDSLANSVREGCINKNNKDDYLDNIIKALYVKNLCSPINQRTRRMEDSIDSRMQSTLSDIIENKIKQKPLPLAMRKRLLYEQAVAKNVNNIKIAN